MAQKRLRIGIVGLQPGVSWAARAHLPALRSLPEDYDLIGVANTSFESAKKAAEATGIPHAFGSVEELINSPEIDVVAVTVKVPHHYDIVKRAIAAGKHVYCEWPLGNGLFEAEELAELARAKGVSAVIGTQARVAPEVKYLQHVISEGLIGDVLSSTIVARSTMWGGSIPLESLAYALGTASGVTMLTIPVGHLLAGLRDILGGLSELSASLSTQRKQARALDTGAILPVTAPDQVLVIGRLEGGAALSIHYRGGPPRDEEGLYWEINGTKGDIRITGPNGHIQLAPLTMACAQGDEKAFRPLPVPDSFKGSFPENPLVGNVARLYAKMAEDIRNGTHTAPSFADAVLVHRVVATITESSDSGRRVEP